MCFSLVTSANYYYYLLMCLDACLQGSLSLGMKNYFLDGLPVKGQNGFHSLLIPSLFHLIGRHVHPNNSNFAIFSIMIYSLVGVFYGIFASLFSNGIGINTFIQIKLQTLELSKSAPTQVISNLVCTAIKP